MKEDGCKHKLAVMDIKNGLSQRFPQNIEDEQAIAKPEAVVQQLPKNTRKALVASAVLLLIRCIPSGS